jgi:hypothetical protein
MSRIEDLALDIAMISNTSMAELAQILIRDYPTRAEAAATFLAQSLQEQDRSVREELGIA